MNRPPTNAFVVSIVGAESTGKTTLSQALYQRLKQVSLAGNDSPVSVAWVTEYLREFCDQHGRTPNLVEQAHIAAEQTRRISEAACRHQIVIADTSALMTAVYSEKVFGDTSLYDDALLAHARADLTLLTALDLPWQADGLQREGPHVREPVDVLLRSALQRAALPFAIVAGQGEQRLEAAWQSLSSAYRLWQRRAQTSVAAAPRAWRHLCARCGDADCERHLFTALR